MCKGTTILVKRSRYYRVGTNVFGDQRRAIAILSSWDPCKEIRNDCDIIKLRAVYSDYDINKTIAILSS